MSSFYGLQDALDLCKALAGTRWRADETIEFRADNSFTVEVHRGSYRWAVHESNKKVTLTWPSSEKIVGTFDWSWTQSKEDGEGGRVFVNVALKSKRAVAPGLIALNSICPFSCPFASPGAAR